jgi:osmotically-inducible protein OsmY
MSDIQIRQEVLDELDYEPSVNAAHIGVAADGGVVTLSGHVRSYAEKVRAVEAARRVRGVRAIADGIMVNNLFDPKTADEAIAKRAIDILGWDALVSSSPIQVMVRDGWVTLSGLVDWHYQKAAAEQDVHKLDGVVGVTNNIVIKPRAQTGDIKRKIEEALRRHAEIEAKTIRVIVKDSDRVVLEGSVANWDERRAVENAAWAAPGVKSVEDHLAIG